MTHRQTDSQQKRTGPDDSRTPALAQTWPTLTCSTRCAEEEEEEDDDEEAAAGGRGGEPGLSLSTQSIEKKRKRKVTVIAVVDQRFDMIVFTCQIFIF